MPTVGIEPTIAPLRVECLTPWPSRRVVARFLGDVAWIYLGFGFRVEFDWIIDCFCR